MHTHFQIPVLSKHREIVFQRWILNFYHGVLLMKYGTRQNTEIDDIGKTGTPPHDYLLWGARHWRFVEKERSKFRETKLTSVEKLHLVCPSRPSFGNPELVCRTRTVFSEKIHFCLTGLTGSLTPTYYFIVFVR